MKKHSSKPNEDIGTMSSFKIFCRNRVEKYVDIIGKVTTSLQAKEP